MCIYTVLVYVHFPLPSPLLPSPPPPPPPPSPLLPSPLLSSPLPGAVLLHYLPVEEGSHEKNSQCSQEERHRCWPCLQDQTSSAGLWQLLYMPMKDEEGQKREASKVKQTTKQTNTAHPRQSTCIIIVIKQISAIVFSHALESYLCMFLVHVCVCNRLLSMLRRLSVAWICSRQEWSLRRWPWGATQRSGYNSNYYKEKKPHCIQSILQTQKL